jgi:positive regulator of sigma E activity
MPDWMSGDGDALGQALTFVVIPLLFGWFGHWLDGRLGIAPVLTVAFALLGVAGVFVTVYYRYQARMAAMEEGKPWARKA